MGLRLTGSIFVVLCALSATALAQNAQQPAAGKPNLNGIWGTPLREQAPEVNKRFPPFKREAASLTPWAQEIFTYNRDPRPGFDFRPELNPEYKCIPESPVRLLQGVASYDFLEIIQTPKRVLLIFQRDHTIRQIWTDGRKLPPVDEVDPSWMGQSIGRWDGDSLIVETVGFKTGNWVIPGVPHTEDLRMTERYRRVDNYLQIDVTVEDPRIFAKPWSTRVIRILNPEAELYPDSRCYQGDAETKAQEELFINPLPAR